MPYMSSEFVAELNRRFALHKALEAKEQLPCGSSPKSNFQKGLVTLPLVNFSSLLILRASHLAARMIER